MKTKTKATKTKSKPVDTKPKPPIRKPAKQRMNQRDELKLEETRKDLVRSAVNGLRKVCFNVLSAQIGARLLKLEKVELDHQTVDDILEIFSQLELDIVKQCGLEDEFILCE